MDEEEEEEEVVVRLVTLLATHLGEISKESTTTRTSHSHSMSRKAAMATGQIYRNGQTRNPTLTSISSSSCGLHR